MSSQLQTISRFGALIPCSSIGSYGCVVSKERILIGRLDEPGCMSLDLPLFSDAIFCPDPAIALRWIDEIMSWLACEMTQYGCDLGERR
jgi:hypothetical protein